MEPPMSSGHRPHRPYTASPPDYSPTWDPGRNAVHRLIQIIDVLAISLGQFRKLSTRLLGRSAQGFAAQQKLWDEYSEVRRAVFPPEEFTPQYSAAILADAAVAELVRMGSSDENSVRDEAKWVAAPGQRPNRQPVPWPPGRNRQRAPQVWDQEGGLLTAYTGVRRGLLAALSRVGHTIPDEVNRRENMVCVVLVKEGVDPAGFGILLEWIRETKAQPAGHAPEANDPAEPKDRPIQLDGPSRERLREAIQSAFDATELRMA